MRTATAILISDIHFSLSNLEPASKALEQAIATANKMEIPLVVAGDLQDTKAILRAEVMNTLLDLLTDCQRTVYILVGNHCMINEKGHDHALSYLGLLKNVFVVDCPVKAGTLGWMFPYYNDGAQLQAAMSAHMKSGDLAIIHQGVQGAWMGHYVQDKTSLPKEVFADYRIISGHYHRAQDIKCGRPRKNGVGLFSYIGSPYTISFAEANDGPKGFKVLYSDGSLELVETNLRKHIIIEAEMSELASAVTAKDIKPCDLVWLKLSGTRSQLDQVKKKDIADTYLNGMPFKFDKVYKDGEKINVNKNTKMTDFETLDQLISQIDDEEPYKAQLKKLWRELLNANT